MTQDKGTYQQKTFYMTYKAETLHSLIETKLLISNRINLYLIQSDVACVSICASVLEQVLICTIVHSKKNIELKLWVKPDLKIATNTQLEADKF